MRTLLDRPGHQPRGLLRMTLIEVKQPQQMQRVRVGGVAAQNLAIQPFGFPQPPRPI
jgi:hypothetical protein